MILNYSQVYISEIDTTLSNLVQKTRYKSVLYHHIWQVLIPQNAYGLVL